jgi:serine/threonine-protein kinase
MGEVFRARDAVLEREVAIKVLHRQLAGDTGFVERFRREARAAANLSHPNIVGVHDWGAVDGVYYMVMEFVRGQSARDILNAQGVIAPAQVADVLMQTLSALDHAHRQGIVHRDVKPENIMITRDGIVKVTDFGLARAYADAQITEAGMVTGTVQYLAPEQLQGEPADPRTDLYALGIVGFELLTGRLPFTAETPMGIAYKHIHERVPAPSSRNPAVPRGLDGWVASMTEKERELRPDSAAEARRDLEAEARSLPAAKNVGTLVPEVSVLPVQTGPARTTTVTIPKSRGAKRTRRRRARWVFGMLLALAALGASAWGAWAYLLPHDVEVPQVLGLSLEAAQQRLEDADLVPRIADGEYSRQVEAGFVLDVDPAEGTTLEPGDRVTLTPSLGHEPVQVPGLIGKTVPRARELLRAADLRLGRVTKAYDEELPAGQILEQSVRAKNDAPFRSEIDLVVSRGPEPKPVPRVTGRTQEEATTLLQAEGFVVAVEEMFSDDIARGKVIAQHPEKGADLQPGETVSIIVSLGPEEFELSNFVGMSKDAAVARIRELGLVPEVIELPGAVGDLTVATQLPLAGTVVRVGTTITIYVA